MKKNLNSLERCKNYRKKILHLSQKVSALHIGGSFSSVEIIDAIFNNLKKKMINLSYQRDMLASFSMWY